MTSPLAVSVETLQKAATHLLIRLQNLQATNCTAQRESAALQRERAAPQRERFDARDPCKGFIGEVVNSHGAIARAIRHARSPQRVRRRSCRFARRHSESDPTRAIPAEGSSAKLQIRTAPQRERSDTHNPRRGFVGQRANSHGARSESARSPQRVCRPRRKFARRHSESDPTRTIPAEGSSAM